MVAKQNNVHSMVDNARNARLGTNGREVLRLESHGIRLQLFSTTAKKLNPSIRNSREPPVLLFLCSIMFFEKREDTEEGRHRCLFMGTITTCPS